MPELTMLAHPRSLLSAGKILPDEKTVADANFKEKDVRATTASDWSNLAQLTTVKSCSFAS